MTRPALTEEQAAALRARVHHVASELGLWPPRVATPHPIEWLKDRAADERAAGPPVRQELGEAGCFRKRQLGTP